MRRFSLAVVHCAAVTSVVSTQARRGVHSQQQTETQLFKEYIRETNAIESRLIVSYHVLYVAAHGLFAVPVITAGFLLAKYPPLPTITYGVAGSCALFGTLRLLDRIIVERCYKQRAKVSQRYVDGRSQLLTRALAPPPLQRCVDDRQADVKQKN